MKNDEDYGKKKTILPLKRILVKHQANKTKGGLVSGLLRAAPLPLAHSPASSQASYAHH